MSLNDLQSKLNRVQNQLIVLKEMRNHRESQFVELMIPKMERAVAEDFDKVCEEWVKARSDKSTPALT